MRLKFWLLLIISVGLCFGPASRPLPTTLSAEEENVRTACSGAYDHLSDPVSLSTKYDLRQSCLFDLATLQSIQFLEEDIKKDKDNAALFKRIIDVEKLKQTVEEKQCPSILTPQCYTAVQSYFTAIKENKLNMTGAPPMNAKDISYSAALGTIAVTEYDAFIQQLTASQTANFDIPHLQEQLKTESLTTISGLWQKTVSTNFDLDKQADRAETILLAALQNFDEMQQSIPLHIQYLKMISALEKIRDRIVVFRENVEQLRESLVNRSK